MRMRTSLYRHTSLPPATRPSPRTLLREYLMHSVSERLMSLQRCCSYGRPARRIGSVGRGQSRTFNACIEDGSRLQASRASSHSPYQACVTLLSNHGDERLSDESRQVPRHRLQWGQCSRHPEKEPSEGGPVRIAEEGKVTRRRVYRQSVCCVSVGERRQFGLSAKEQLDGQERNSECLRGGEEQRRIERQRIEQRRIGVPPRIR